MSITNFIRNNFLMLLLLSIMLINPFYYGYRVAIVFLVFLIFYLNRTVKLIDKNVFYLFFFAGLYHFISATRIDAVNDSILSFLPDVFLPSVMYIIGKGVSTKHLASDVRVFFLFFIMLFFSIIPIISIIVQIVVDGFLGARALYLLWDKNTLISATGLGAYFSMNMGAIALLNSPKSNKIQKIISYLIILLFVFSLICVFRLGNRSQLLIAGISITLSYIYNFKKMSKFSRFSQFIFFGFVIGYVVYLFTSQSELVKVYEDRLDSTEYGFSSVGGRWEKWLSALESIGTDPLGWDLSRFGYSHNLWLDVARVSGILALFPLILFSFSSFKLVLKSLKIVHYDKFLSTFIFVFFISINSMFFIEPIMEGMYLLFFVFCLFIGFLAGICSNYCRISLR